ncbi:MAG: hypothetical protein LBL94_02510, partial [Prevotellaceae bacterium]|nr:hypothetical protein [Prevotellaceae bacterium]
MKLANSPDMRNTSLYFYDLNAKINYRINDNNRLFLLGYLGRDNLSTDYMGMSFGNKTATLRWNHIFLPKLFSIYMVDVLLYGQLPESEHNYLNVQAFKNGVAINGKLANFSIIVSENAVNKEINGEQCLYLFRKNDNSELMSQSSGFTPVEDGDLIRVQVSSI